VPLDSLAIASTALTMTAGAAYPVAAAGG